METLQIRQKEIIERIQRIKINFKKDGADRKTADYIQKRLESLDNLWKEFLMNHTHLLTSEDLELDYFTKDIYSDTERLYKELQHMFTSYQIMSSTSNANNQPDINQNDNNELKKIMSQQNTNFRAFLRMVNNFDIEQLNDKWDLEDELRNIQMRWNNIDTTHWQIDNQLQGSDDNYDKEYSRYEVMYKDIKKQLSKKLNSTMQLQHTTPKLEIPTFYGDYTTWPTFYDLYGEAIHNNPTLTKAKKMQHLKGKLRGEAERLIQHLHVSAENYDTAWERLVHRYNNIQALFTKHIELMLNQPAMQKQSANDLKKFYDISMETIHGIHNLGVDTSSWDPLIVHLLVKKLDVDTYSQYKDARKNPRELPVLEEFLAFIEYKFTALEPLQQKKERSEASIIKHSNYSIKQRYEKPSESRNYATNKSYHTYNQNKNNCILCKNDHALFQCTRFLNMTPDNKLSTVRKNNICKNCLYFHEHNICNSNKRCKLCNEPHNTLLHDAFTRSNIAKSYDTNNQHRGQQPLQQRQHMTSSHVAGSDDDEILLPTIEIKVFSVEGSWITFRALLDQGSQITLITERAAQILGLPRSQADGSISGVGTLANKIKGKLTLTCKSIHDNYEFMTEAMIMTKVTNNLPNNSFDRSMHYHIQHLQLADPSYNVSKAIDILFDAKVYSEIIMSGILRGQNNHPIAQQTKLGWILSGKVTTLNCYIVSNHSNDISKYWEMEEIMTDCNDMTEDELKCEKLFKSTTCRLPNGKYEVQIPMKDKFEEKLGQSKAQAIAQFKQLERKFEKNTVFYDSYKDFIHEYLALGHMKPSLTNDRRLSCYLPHHGVLKLDSATTKLRVVFNASAKTISGNSLNDLMECGPKLQKDLQAMLLRWRVYKIAFSADCEKMYRCILIKEHQQPLQKIVWRDSPHDKLQEYQLCTITYGMKAAPYLSMRTMQQLTEDDREKYPIAAQVLARDFFVDDLLSGSQTIEEALTVQGQLIDMLHSAGLNLRKWTSNEPKLLQNLTNDRINPHIIEFKDNESTKALGLLWNPSTDSFSFKSKINIDINAEKITKRMLLSDISTLFDPLGWLSPITIKAKLLFQNVWVAGLAWDDKLPYDMLQEWKTLRQDLTNIDNFKIPRWLGDTQNNYQLHGFCDASEKVFACVIYLRSQDSSGSITSRILAAKTKLAPQHKIATLPRLELCGAVLLSTLMQKVKQALREAHTVIDDRQIYAWTDSMIVLGWCNQ